MKHPGSYLNKKFILVTGATGSFGKKFIEILLKEYNFAKLIIYSRDELKQGEMRSLHGFSDPRLRYFIGDVRDKERLMRAMAGVEIVVHAAALKQVPALEYNPIEAVKTNIYGSENIINCAIDSGVKKTIALSTDKAVNPINLYGATKLVGEKLFIQGNNYSSLNGPKFSVVRYGNVVGSRGSVVPLFLHQKNNGKITVTDKDMTRFWITLEQGVRFVINSIETMKGGEIFVPKIPSMKIMDLAEVIAPKNKIEIIGIRPGEKTHEMLIGEDESRNTYEFGDMYAVRPVNLFREPKNKLWKKGKKMKSGTYASNTNKKWLTKERLGKIIKEI